MSCSRNKPRFLTTSNYNYNITKSNIFAATVGKLGSGESQVIYNNRVITKSIGEPRTPEDVAV